MKKKQVDKVYIKIDIVTKDDNRSPRCDICNIVVYQSSYAKHLRNKKHLEEEKLLEMTIPEWLFEDLL